MASAADAGDYTTEELLRVFLPSGRVASADDPGTGDDADTIIVSTDFVASETDIPDTVVVKTIEMVKDYMFKASPNLFRDVIVPAPPPGVASADREGGASASFYFGVSRGRSGMAPGTREGPSHSLQKHINSVARDHYLPDFTWTSVVINVNTIAKPHPDGNVGDSLIFAVGDYEGGELQFHDVKVTGKGKDRQVEILKTHEPPINLHNRFLRFNGNNWHSSLPFSGERISVVFYTSRWLSGKHTKPEDLELLTLLGFRLPGSGIAPPPMFELEPGIEVDSDDDLNLIERNRVAVATGSSPAGTANPATVATGSSPAGTADVVEYESFNVQFDYQGKTRNVIVSTFTTVWGLKEIVFNKNDMDVSPLHQVWKFNGQLLQDDALLDDYNIGRDSRLRFEVIGVPPLPGGAPKVRKDKLKGGAGNKDAEDRKNRRILVKGRAEEFMQVGQLAEVPKELQYQVEEIMKSTTWIRDTIKQMPKDSLKLLQQAWEVRNPNATPFVHAITPILIPDLWMLKEAMDAAYDAVEHAYIVEFYDTEQGQFNNVKFKELLTEREKVVENEVMQEQFTKGSRFREQQLTTMMEAEIARRVAEALASTPQPMQQG